MWMSLGFNFVLPEFGLDVFEFLGGGCSELCRIVWLVFPIVGLNFEAFGCV